MDEMTEGMSTHIVGDILGTIALSCNGITFPISNLYEGKRIVSTDVDCFGRIEHEIVIEVSKATPEQLFWAWDHLSLGKLPGVEAIIYGGFNYGKLVPIIKFNKIDINALEKRAGGFRFKATAERILCM